MKQINNIACRPTDSIVHLFLTLGTIIPNRISQHSTPAASPYPLTTVFRLTKVIHFVEGGVVQGFRGAIAVRMSGCYFDIADTEVGVAVLLYSRIEA